VGARDFGDRASHLLLVVEPGDDEDGHLAAPREPTARAESAPKRTINSSKR